MAADRDTEIQRSGLLESVKYRAWGRAAARCVLCSQWLINDQHFWHEIPVGELAHIVAASSGKNAPRGDSALDTNDRALEANILLLCHSCHRAIDSKAHRDEYSVEFLRARKAEHEKRVREVTDFPTLRPATVLRVHGSIRSSISPPTAEQISHALLHSGLTGLDADTRNGRFDVSLDHSEKEEWSWQAARSQIDKRVAQIYEAIAGEDTRVVAVFAIAPIPALVYLGSRLDDKVETVLLPRQRVDNYSTWSWPKNPPPPVRFETSCEAKSSVPDDIVAVINVSGTVNPSRIPTLLQNFPVITVAPVDETPRPDLVESLDTLNEFGSAWRAALATVEAKWPQAQRIHIIAAVPTTVAIMIGRYRMRDAHPAFFLYQRTDTGTYENVMEISE